MASPAPTERGGNGCGVGCLVVAASVLTLLLAVYGAIVLVVELWP